MKKDRKIKSKLPFAVWKNIVEKQENSKQDNKSNDHTEVNNIFRNRRDQRKILADMCVNPVTKHQNSQCRDQQ